MSTRRDIVKATISSHEYAGMITIGWSIRVPDDDLAIRSHNEIIKRTNRLLYGKSAYRSGKVGLRGYCCAERCRQVRLSGTLHFHDLIFSQKVRDSQLTADNFEQVIEPVLQEAISTIVNGQGTRMTAPACVKASRFSGMGTLPSYLTKEFEANKSGDAAYGLFAPLSPFGAVGLEPLRNKQ